MPLAEAVLDASAAVRGLLHERGTAARVVDGIVTGATAAHAPDLLVAEAASALRAQVAAGRWPVEAARRALDTMLAWPLSLQPCAPLAGAALVLALERGLSAYDAFYAVLAEALGVPLVTADRRLAAAVADAVLVE